MPDWSSLAAERDVFGELGWIPNFDKKLSKDNAKRHMNYREFFDQPKDYASTFTNAAVTNSEFFREQAPEQSVAFDQRSRSAHKSPSAS